MAQYTLTNLGKRSPRRGTILNAPPLEIEFDGISMTNLVNYCTVQDLRLPSYDNIGMTAKYEEELHEIISGKSNYWKIWKVVITDTSLNLHIIDTETHGARKGKYTVLLCKILWPDGVRIKLSADRNFGDWEDVASEYYIKFSANTNLSEKKRLLTVEYRILEEKHKDTYEVITPI